jgi:hypothetical protein
MNYTPHEKTFLWHAKNMSAGWPDHTEFFCVVRGAAIVRDWIQVLQSNGAASKKEDRLSRQTASHLQFQSGTQ